MNNNPSTMEELARLGQGLVKPAALAELAVLAACLMLAWLLARLLRGREARPGSIWFGERIVDGVLFPVLALAAALLASWGLRTGLGHPIAVFKLAVPILVSLALIRLTVRVLRASFPGSQLMRVVERSVSWLAWGAVVLWVTGVLPLVLAELDAITWKVGSTRLSLRSMLEGAFSAIVAMLLALWAGSMLEARLLRGATANLGVRKMAANALRALLLFVGIVVALSAAGIDLTALGVLGGAVGVGIGLGLQKLAANYVSGFVILAEDSMRIGDMVKVDNFEGRITDIKTRYTVIRSLGGRESIVPNDMMITQRIENSSLADPKVSISTVVLVAHGTDVDALIPKIVDTVRQVPRVIDDPAPGVLLSNLVGDGLELSVGFWIADPERGLLGVRSQVNLALLRLFRELGVQIPVPQESARPS